MKQARSAYGCILCWRELDTPDDVTPILCDINVAINLLENLLFHLRVKLVDIKYHFLREPRKRLWSATSIPVTTLQNSLRMHYRYPVSLDSVISQNLSPDPCAGSSLLGAYAEEEC